MSKQENNYLIQGEEVRHVIRNLRQARWELKHGFLMSCDCYLDYCLGVLLQTKEAQQNNLKVSKE